MTVSCQELEQRLRSKNVTVARQFNEAICQLV